ncbi:MAG: 7-carboxy-7-deazaguanine synthase QueE, partial [Rhodocyclaceae bacterium]|nr:7-carboxy-7-deazaguanine synthase QueE [Rhodocyclaceae bacterium]
DYAWARKVIGERKLDAICPVLLSPVAGKLDPKLLAEWVLRDRLPVRVQLQLHKLIWGAERGR